MSGFDAIETTHRLEERGFSRDQAEMLAKLFDDLWGATVTRQVLREELAPLATRVELKSEIVALRAELKADTAALRAEMGALEQRLTIRLGSIMIAGLGVLSTVLHFWK